MSPKTSSKIGKIRRYLNIVESLKAECEEKFNEDPIYQGALLHYLYLISDSVVSLSQMVLKERKIDYAQSYYESIDLLGEHGLIPREFAYDFAKIASMRNFLAHDYEKVDYKKICQDVLGKLSDVEKFLQMVEKL
jgi:uncharacterized protein YutE (UPF0331/DUF86 family)